MAIEFNKYDNRYQYLHVNQDTSKKTQETEKKEQVKDVEQLSFIGLKNETDLLTHNTQNLYGINFTKASIRDREIAKETNEILASLGYKNFKVSPEQVARISSDVSNVILPVMKGIEDNATALNIQDPDGPFADLFI